MSVQNLQMLDYEMQYYAFYVIYIKAVFSNSTAGQATFGLAALRVFAVNFVKVMIFPSVFEIL